VVNRDRLSALGFLAFSIAYGVLAYDIELYFVAPDDPFTARTFPIALAWAGGLVALLMLVLPGTSKPAFSLAAIKAMDWPRLIALAVLMVAYGLTIKRIGFLVSTTVFLAIGYALLGERRWWLLLLASLPVAAGFQLALHGLLGIYIADPLLKSLGLIR
jgi:putative tricarboxylic transport membrane protein